MDSYWYKAGEFLAQSMFIVSGLVLVTWGFQQRQEYEKRQDGTIKLAIGGGLLALAIIPMILEMTIRGLTPHEDTAAPVPDVQAQMAENDAEGVSQAVELLEISQLVRVKSRSPEGIAVAMTYVDEDTSGTITVPTGTIRLVRTEGTTYVNPSPGAWNSFGQTASAISSIDRRWVRLDGKDTDLDTLGRVGTRDWLNGAVPSNVRLVRGPLTTIHGIECRILKTPSGTQLCHASDPHRILRIESSTGEVLDLFYEGATPRPKVPDRVVDASTIFP